jgi:hypothetical protein
MSGMHALHLFALATWLGVVLAETVLELLVRARADFAAPLRTLHYWIDLFVEAPLLLAIVATGTALAWGRPIDAALAAKMACGLATVCANAFCVLVVVRRKRAEPDSSEARRLDRHVLASGLGAPFAVTALILGGQRMGWW